MFGAAREHAKAAVFVLTAGSYFCMVAESNGEAVLFDAPEGIVVIILFICCCFLIFASHHQSGNK